MPNECPDCDSMVCRERGCQGSIPTLPPLEDIKRVNKRFTIERVIKVYDDDTGNHFYVGPDADGLDGMEIRDVNSEGKIDARFFMGREQAVLVARAILELYGDKR